MSLLNQIKQLLPFSSQKMNAIGFDHALSIDEEHVFIEKRVKIPRPSEHDLRVKISANAFNPVDTKMRANYSEEGVFRVLGFDAVGTVDAIGSAVTKFAVGDKVYYAGSQRQQGANAEYQVVHEDLVGHAPRHLNDAEIAAMPLTTITATEILHDAFGYEIQPDIAIGKSILVLNGAGGVGSVLIQLAKYMGMTVITTASRPESVAWVKNLGADYILDYKHDLKTQLENIQFSKVSYIAILQNTDAYWPLVLDTIEPFGRIASIVETNHPIDMGPLKNIGAQFSWVFMFAKGNYGINMASQGSMLNQMADLLDKGMIKSTLSTVLHGFTVDNIKTATKMVEEGHNIGKVIVLYGK